MHLLRVLSDSLLFLSCLFILFGSLYLTFRMRCVQFKFFPALFKMLWGTFQKKETLSHASHTISPQKALFTAMSTTLGIATIVGPVIAIHIGGPGALFGFLLTSFFGSAATYAEVNLSLQYRKKMGDGTIMGGPMQYLAQIFSPFMAKWYAVCCLLLMVVWSGAQANQLVAILDSPLLGLYRIPTAISGGCVALLILITLMGGIKRIGSFSAKLVPLMFLLYVGSLLWILGVNYDKWGAILGEMMRSALSPYPLASGAVVGGIMSSLRWGIFKGIQTSEAGIGTQAIPHSMAETKDPMAQGILSMLSTYTAGIVAFLSGCVALITGTWQDPSLPLGMTMVAASFQLYFSYFGIAIVVISSLLFGFGTILGNSYNGSQCYGYLTKNRRMPLYLFATAGMIYGGSVIGVKTIWSAIDAVLALMAVPHIAALVYQAYKNPETLIAKKERPSLLLQKEKI